jgi:hypothetical protein
MANFVLINTLLGHFDAGVKKPPEGGLNPSGYGLPVSNG